RHLAQEEERDVREGAIDLTLVYGGRSRDLGGRCLRLARRCRRRRADDGGHQPARPRQPLLARPASQLRLGRPGAGPWDALIGPGNRADLEWPLGSHGMGKGSQRLLCPTLIGRDEQLAVLAELLAGAARGQGQTIVIGGEAGDGKAERIILIGTYRTDELHRRHVLRPVLADLAAARSARTMELAALDRGATGRVIRETLRLSRDAPAAFVDALYGRCEGNPFFIEETLDAMRARGALRERDGEWLGVDSPELSLPDSVRDAVDRRYGLLFDDAKRVLRIAAVIGQRFEFDLLAMVAEISREGLIEVLRSAIEAQ